MGPYLVVAHDPAVPGAAALSTRLKADARADGLTVRPLGARAWIGVGGPHPPATRDFGPWTLIGDAFHRVRPVFPACAPDDPWSYERQLTARVWGRFVGVRLSAAGEITALLRDPSGALDCVAWTQDGLTLVASDVPPAALRRLRPPWRVDLDRLALALRDPLTACGDLLLRGPLAVHPGTVQPLPLDRPAASIWSPAQMVDRGAGLDAAEPAAARLRDAVDEAVRGLAGTAGALAVEVSGGLDSSIVAASLVGSGRRVRVWLNAHAQTPEADERIYAAALGRALNIKPTPVPFACGPLTVDLLETISGGFRPGLNALDLHHDLDWARRIPAAGARAVMTGKGGDSVLLQAVTADLLADRWLASGWPALFSRDTLRLAAATEASVWTLVRQARRRLVDGVPPPSRDEDLLAPHGGDRPLHPWLAEVQGLGPARTLQLAGIIDNISRHTPSLQTRTLDVLHPLCAQPVVEACLAIPTASLTLGVRDRGLARYAFRDRLPREIVERRSKGDLTRIYGRMVADSLPVLRPWLLDGELAAAGLLDRPAAEALLTPDSLMARGGYAEILVAAAFEGWLRRWSSSLQQDAKEHHPRTASG